MPDRYSLGGSWESASEPKFAGRIRRVRGLRGDGRTGPGPDVADTR
jgi:hypothetical protein